MFDALIYDFDGTLSDTYPVATKVFCAMLAERGIEADPAHVYASLKITYGYAMDEYGFVGATRREFEARADALALVEQKPFPDAKYLLETAASRGKRNFIYTHSGDVVAKLLHKWGWEDTVTYVLDSTQGFPRKPDPAALRFLIRKFDLDPAASLMVGDRDIDVDAGHNAGLASCLFDEGGYYRDYPAEYRVHTLSEILDII